MILPRNEVNRNTFETLDKGPLEIDDGLILAAGAWSSAIEGIPQLILPPIKPMKGQMLAVGMTDGLLNHIILGEHGYYFREKAVVLSSVRLSRM